jgi:hypothetical protein
MSGEVQSCEHCGAAEPYIGICCIVLHSYSLFDIAAAAAALAVAANLVLHFTVAITDAAAAVNNQKRR